MNIDLENIGKLVVAIGAIGGGVLYFAPKSYVDDRTRRVNAYVEGETVSKIMRYKCRRPRDTTFDARLNEAQGEYKRLMDRDYEMPDCELLGITPEQ